MKKTAYRIEIDTGDRYSYHVLQYRKKILWFYVWKHIPVIKENFSLMDRMRERDCVKSMDESDIAVFVKRFPNIEKYFCKQKKENRRYIYIEPNIADGDEQSPF